MKKIIRLILIIAILELVPVINARTAKPNPDVYYRTSLEDVAEVLLESVFKIYGDQFVGLGISREDIPDLKKELAVQKYAEEIILERSGEIPGKIYSSDITEGNIYYLAGLLKLDICKQFYFDDPPAESRYIGEYIRSTIDHDSVTSQMVTGGLTWVRNWKSCTEVLGDSVLMGSKLVYYRMDLVDVNIPKFGSSGITFYLADNTKYGYADAARALEFAKNKVKDKSIKLIVVYGHGGPQGIDVGDKTVAGSDFYSITAKLAPEAEIHFVGCNTAGDVKLGVEFDPYVLGSLVLKAVYKGIAYPFLQGARAIDKYSDVSHTEVVEGINADLAKEASSEIKDIQVCGFSTFGFVPERFPFIGPGRKNRIEPGAVIGAVTCYKNGGPIAPSRMGIWK